MASVSEQGPYGYGLTPGVRRLAVILGLPLLDGVFVMLVLSGVLATPAGIVLTGAVVFAGSATVAVILADLADQPRRHLPGVLAIGAVLIGLAGLQAAIAPTIASILDTEMLTRFAAILLVLMAIHVSSERWGRRLPKSGIIVILGLIASVRPNGITLERSIDLELALAGMLAAGVGVALAVTVLLLGSRMLPLIDRDRFRYGGSLALLALAVAVLGVIPPWISLLILALTVILAVNPSRPIDMSVSDQASERRRTRQSESKSEQPAENVENRNHYTLNYPPAQ